VVQALRKWRADLLENHANVYADHRTLEDSNTQRDLSQQQFRWQEDMSRYYIQMHYICGEDNSAADALS